MVFKQLFFILILGIFSSNVFSLHVMARELSVEEQRGVQEIHRTQEFGKSFKIESEKPQLEDMLEEEVVIIDRVEPVEEESTLRDKLVLDYDAEDTTQYGEVRKQAHIVSVGYRLKENAVLGIEAQTEIADAGDESVRGKSIETDDGLNVKYKVEF